MNSSNNINKSMMNLFSFNNGSKTKTRFNLFSSNSSKKSAKKLMKQSNGYGSYSNLFRAQSYDTLCTIVKNPSKSNNKK